jgi:uncharacterized protein (DUF58 family)
MIQEHSTRGRWLWLAAFGALAMLALSGGKLLMALGFVLLGVFAFFNNPLAPTPAQVARPSTPVGLSWACGMLGVTAIVAAAARTWL